MITIIEQGGKEVYINRNRCICNRCDSILEFDDKDIKLLQVAKIEGFSAIIKYYGIFCPVCKRGIKIRSFSEQISQPLYFTDYKDSSTLNYLRKR